MNEPKTYRSGETFTVTRVIKPQEDDMITATDTGITYVYRNGEWQPVTFSEGERRG